MRLRPKLKVGQPIVGLLPVDVMNLLGRQERAPESTRTTSRCSGTYPWRDAIGRPISSSSSTRTRTYPFCVVRPPRQFGWRPRRRWQRFEQYRARPEEIAIKGGFARDTTSFARRVSGNCAPRTTTVHFRLVRKARVQRRPVAYSDNSIPHASDVLRTPYSLTVTEIESCWRCGANMEWRHGTWQCGRCHFKLGCCEGDPQTACDVQEPFVATPRDAVPLHRT
jgi:hypothetical protein